MRLFVGITDESWFRYLRGLAADEANFWQPSGSSHFRALSPGDPFLFKLHAPRNFIVGGGFFAHFSLLPCSLAWETFGQLNGTDTLREMRLRIEKYRRISPSPREDYQVGCIILAETFFLDDQDWIPVPDDFARNIVRGKSYDTSEDTGAKLWEAVSLRLAMRKIPLSADNHSAMYGEPVLVRPRLGQGAFRVIITDTYERHCAISRERVLPVLEAAHIKPVSEGGQHEISNGLLLRSDLHRLYDRGYLTVAPDLAVHVSKNIDDEFHNGKEYYALEGTRLWIPPDAADRPRHEYLEWHADTVFLR